MKENKNMAPKLRFPEFTDEWEQRKCKELLVERNEQAPKDEEYPLMAFIAGQGVAPKGDRYDRGFLVKDEDTKKYKHTEYGDFIYSSNNLTTGSIGLNQYGKACISPVYSIFYPTELTTSDFIGRLMCRPEFINKMIRTRQGVMYGQWRIHESEFLEIDTLIPSLEEQKKIGALLATIDNTIALHQRKLDSMKEYKKGLLQKMFPKDGEKVPEIRFPGFTDEWEQRKLSDNATFSKGRGYSKSDLRESGTPIILYGRMYTKYQTVIDKVDTFAEEVNNSVISQGNEVIVPASGESAEEISVASSVKKSGVILGGDLNIIRPNKDILPEFLALQITYGSQHFELSKRAQGKTVSHLHNDDFKDIRVSVPSLDEQEKINSVFAHIDNTIALHQRKLDQMKEYKKGLLQQMFV